MKKLLYYLGMDLFSSFSPYADSALLFLRLVLGGILLAHGLPKVRNIKGTSQWFESAGFKPGIFWAPLVATVESVGALALIAGFGVQCVAAVLTIQFIVINVWRIFRHEPLVGGFELDLIILASLLVLMTMGSGAFSLGLGF